MKTNKCLFTVCVDGYHPEIVSETIPAMKLYAEKIGADFKIIAERKFPGWPPTYEKMQVYELGKKYDCNILVDADLLITEDMYDVSKIVPEWCIGTWMIYDPAITIKKDEHIKLDGTGRIIATNFVLARRAQHDLWKPFAFSKEEALSRMKREFVVDEYCMGRNLVMHKYSIMSLALPGAANNLFFHKNVTTNNA